MFGKFWVHLPQDVMGIYMLAGIIYCPLIIMHNKVVINFFEITTLIVKVLPQRMIFS